jgi:hypothetical protein
MPQPHRSLTALPAVAATAATPAQQPSTTFGSQVSPEWRGSGCQHPPLPARLTPNRLPRRLCYYQAQASGSCSSSTSNRRPGKWT